MEVEAFLTPRVVQLQFHGDPGAFLKKLNRFSGTPERPKKDR
jgi:hypothetical protein